MEQKILEIKDNALKEIEKASDMKSLEEVKNKYLSRASELNNLKKGLKDIPAELRPKIGALTNQVSKEIEALVNEKQEEFYTIELNKKLESEKIDITLPSTYEPSGHIHPLTKTINEITEIFELLGFSLIENKYSPEVETVKYNFDLLNTPKEHPARDVQDTFYSKLGENVVLRSQTSNAQVRQMQNSRPPIKIISPAESIEANRSAQEKITFSIKLKVYMLIKTLHSLTLKEF